MPVTVYGASDDLIEIEGDITEEFNEYLSEDGSFRYFVFSNGVLLKITYDMDGFWRLFVLSGHELCTKTEATDIAYSDKVTINGDIEWVVCGTKLRKR